MKRLVIIALLVLLALPALAAPTPKFENVSTFANDETVYLAVRGRQTGQTYKTAYVTVKSTENVYIEFDAAAELQGFYTGTESAAWGGRSFTYAVGNEVFCPADEAITLKVKAEYFTFKGVTTPGAMDVWTEYE